jgi:hypothetical protein
MRIKIIRLILINSKLIFQKYPASYLMKSNMKKTSIALLLQLPALFFVLILLFYSCNTKHQIVSDSKFQKEENDMYDGAAAAEQFEFERTKDPALGYVPKDRLLEAYQYTEFSKQLAMRSRTTTATWVERGPTADSVGTGNGNTRDGVNPVASGRMRAIWVDLTDVTGNTVWIGGVAGGLWKTTNFKTSPATWTPVNDFFTNMAISSICQDPVNKNIMYFCTGEAYTNFDAVRGIGVFKSTDFGATWAALATTSTYTNCSKIVCDASGNIYLGTFSSGLLRSTVASGGAVWTAITPTGLSARVADIDISSTGRLHLNIGLGNTASGGYRYTDVPASVTSNSPNWKTPTTAFTYPSGANTRVEMACLGNTLYALPSNNSANVTTIYKSTDGGDTWAATGSTPAFTSGQAWYCLGADIDPSNADNVVVGSLDCWASTNGGTTWTQISDWATGGTTGKYVHADQQIIEWYASNELLIGTDGGIFYSADGGGTISDRNTGLRIKQFFSCDYHPSSMDYFLAGAQDNGCHMFSSPGLNTTTEITGGDGGFVHIDQNEPTYQFASYVRNRYRRSTDNWSSVSYVNFFRGTSASGGSDFGSFINPTDYDNTANILYCGAGSGELFRWSTAKTTASGNYYSYDGFPAGADTLNITGSIGTISAVTVSSHTANRVYLGTNSSKIIIIDNAHSFTSNSAGTSITSASFPAGSTVSCLAVGSDDNNLIATFSNYGVSNIWVTTNGGTSWTTIDGNLPDMPVRWAVFDPTSNTKAWIATETGVWSTTLINGASTVWTASPGFPTIRTDMIKYRSADQTLVAATHGRGLWTQSLAIVLPINNFVLRGTWKTTSTVELSWDYSNNSGASFEIESSANGTYFTKASASQINTNYLDQPATTDIYYRVKGKNIFGNVSYSNVIHLQKGVETRDITAVKIFPNPVRNNMKVAFASSGSGIAHYQITSVSGQVCWKKDEDISATGEYIREWNMQSLKPGTYLFTIIYNNKKITHKFSKL